MNEQEVRKLIRQELENFAQGLPFDAGTGRGIFNRHIQLLDGRNIQVGKGTGTIIGTETTQKLGFFGATPVIQPTVATVGAGAGDSDGTARAGVDAIIKALSASASPSGLGLFS